MNTLTPIFPEKNKLIYTALFCEENIYHLGKTLIELGFNINTINVIFLSNTNKTIPLLQQKTQTNNCPYVLWDYHVILQLNHAQQDWVLDFDSNLDFPSLKHEYFQKTFIAKEKLNAEFHVYARKIPLADYLRQFSSSRSHMRDTYGRPLTAFPAYPAIQANNKDEATDLMSYIDMQAHIQNSSVHLL